MSLARPPCISDRMARLIPYILALSLGLFAACATPVMPTGGPVDRTPPELVRSVPASDSVMVRTDRLLLEFSKPIEEASLRQAVDIVPDFPSPPRVSARGHRAEIVFPTELRENTTYVITIGTQLRDLRNNRLPAPITIAFATGPQLDTGEIRGWVQDPASGEGVPDIQMFAYALADTTATPPDPRTTEPDYRTETDNQGRFVFSYLRDQPFFVAAVEDLNRNRRADPGERFAAPFEPAVVPTPADAEETTPPLPLFMTSVDTLRPEPLRVRPISDSRFALRFTESIMLVERTPAAFAITDSLTGSSIEVRDVYADTDPAQIVIHTTAMSRSRHLVDVAQPSAVRDSAGNFVRPSSLTFTPSAAPDTARARFVAFEPAGSDTLRTLLPSQPASIRFSQPPADPGAPERISAVTMDGDALPIDVSTRDGARYEVIPEQQMPFRLAVSMPDSVYTMRYMPLPADSLGDVTGRVVDIPEDVPVVVEATTARGEVVRVNADPDGTFVIRGLPAGVANLRVFADSDGSGTWSGGLLAPYRPPELLTLVTNVRVRARWETEVEPISLDPSAAQIPDAPTPDDEPEIDRETPDDLIPLPGMR